MSVCTRAQICKGVTGRAGKDIISVVRVAKEEICGAERPMTLCESSSPSRLGGDFGFVRMLAFGLFLLSLNTNDLDYNNPVCRAVL